MPRGKQQQATFSPAEAKAILERLLRQGRLNRGDIDQVRGRIETERQDLLARLEALGGLPAAVAGVAVGAAAVTAAPAVARGVKRAVATVRGADASPARIASRKLQGRYLGLMRQIPRSTVNQRFGADAIKARGKETVVAEMEAYLREQSGGQKSAARAGAKRAAPRRRRKS